MSDENENRKQDGRGVTQENEGGHRSQSQAEATESEDFSAQVEINLNPDFFVEFQLSVVEKKYSKQEMQDLLYEILPSIVAEDDILGVQLMPWN